MVAFELVKIRVFVLQNLSQEVSFLSAALQEERFRTERLEEQVNDLTELHQNEVTQNTHNFTLFILFAAWL